jgi:hypothetical protein
LERKTLDLSAKFGDFAIKRQATWGMSASKCDSGNQLAFWSGELTLLLSSADYIPPPMHSIIDVRSKPHQHSS